MVDKRRLETANLSVFAETEGGDAASSMRASSSDVVEASNRAHCTGFAGHIHDGGATDLANLAASINSIGFIGPASAVDSSCLTNHPNSVHLSSIASLTGSASSAGSASSVNAASSIRQTALNYLSRREYSAKELADKLIDKGFARDQVKQELAHLQMKGWQSDQRFAESLLRSRLAAGYGPRHIARELQIKGVDSAIVDALLAGELAADIASLDWKQQAKHALIRRFGRHMSSNLRGNDGDRDNDGDRGDGGDNDVCGHEYNCSRYQAAKKDRERQFRYLLRKGFEIDLIKELLNERDED